MHAYTASIIDAIVNNTTYILNNANTKSKILNSNKYQTKFSILEEKATLPQKACHN